MSSPLHIPFWKNGFLCFFLLGLIAGSEAQQKKNDQAKFPDIFNSVPIPDASALSALKEGEDPLSKIRTNLFIEASISKTSCYVGEPILLRYELYSALQNESEIEKLPAFTGFGVEEISVSNEQVIYKNIHGRSYRAFNLREFILTPQEEGKLTVDSLFVNNRIHYQIAPDSVRHYAGMIAGKPLTIAVRPLPAEKKPSGFSGAVGHFLLTASVDSLRIPAGETNTLHLTISGNGNFIALNQPPVQWPPDVDYFPVQEKTLLTKNSFPPAGRQTFDIPFVPSREGEFTIPALEISYFDADSGRYEKSSSRSIVITVGAPKIRLAPGVPVLRVPGQPGFLWIRISVPVILLMTLLVFIRRKKTE